MSEPPADTTGVGGDGIGYCIRPGTAVPPTVLVANMDGGALFLQGWRVGPSAYVCAADSAPLREALAAAFGSGPPRADQPVIRDGEVGAGDNAVPHPRM
ncbi:MAG: hypothetical protein ACRDQX_14970 [Pseudonocardiaceae bacterium]